MIEMEYERPNRQKQKNTICNNTQAQITDNTLCSIGEWLIWQIKK